MALFTPDYKYIEAKNMIDNLGDSAKDELIKYYIKKKEEQYNDNLKIIERYANFFRALNSLLPKNGKLI